MRDIELYRAILGFPTTWTVLDVDLDVKGRQVTVSMNERRLTPRNRDCSGSLWLVEPSAMLRTIDVAARMICDRRLYSSLRGRLSARA